MKFVIEGKHKVLSKEELRAVIQAAATVLEFHGGALNADVMKVTIAPNGTLGKCRVGGRPVAGQAHISQGAFTMIDSQPLEEVTTLVIHEMIHLMMDPNSEKATSTLTAKLKPTVTAIYNTLIDGVYKRAAYVAHTKIAYKHKGEDEYNNEQYNKTGVSVLGEKYRRETAAGVN